MLCLPMTSSYEECPAVANVTKTFPTSRNVIGLTTSCAKHSKSNPSSYCSVLPPGEFNSVIPVPLPIYPESVITIAVPGFSYYIAMVIRKALRPWRSGGWCPGQASKSIFILVWPWCLIFCIRSVVTQCAFNTVYRVLLKFVGYFLWYLVEWDVCDLISGSCDLDFDLWSPHF